MGYLIGRHMPVKQNIPGKEEERNTMAEVMHKGPESMVGGWGSRLRSFPRIWGSFTICDEFISTEIR